MTPALTPPSSPFDELWRMFMDPPDSARPRAWWHWMDGNIDPAGIRRDLTWLHQVGVRGAQLFDGGMGVPLVVAKPVRPGSATWREAVDEAVRTAEELGLELAVATSSGWSATGGPWVRPEDAMKKVVWSETIIDGGGRVECTLTALPSTPGLFQDTPRWGAASTAGFSVEWRTVAIPDHRAFDALRPVGVASSAESSVTAWEPLIDGSFATGVTLPRDPHGLSRAWIEQVFDEPVTVRSVTVGLPGPRGFGAAPPPEAVLQASSDGVSFRDVARLDVTTVPARTASFAPVTARYFRLALEAASAADALPPVSEGVRTPPVLRTTDVFVVSEFALRTAARVHHAEVKSGHGVVADYYAVDTDPAVTTGADAATIDPASVIDLGAFVHDGVLRWECPPGRWRVLRLGASLTGASNGPAPADSTGLEVDKLDGARVADFLQTHLARFGDATGMPSRFRALLSDSIEAGPQNWTDRILEHFLRRRGYDPTPWLPSLAGYLVRDASASDRFLFDYRRTVAEVFADEYYGTLAQEAHRRGMSYYAEALEDARPQIGDDLAMRAYADIPMGAMWTFDPAVGPRPTYVADLKGAASVAHVYGKEAVGSEAFTSFDAPWSWSPQTLKHIADLQLSLGVTRFCLHTSPHQPLAVRPPGISLAPFLGQAFTVNETWASMAGPWIDYLARCSAILNAGSPAVDVALFVGEEAPVTGLFTERFDDCVPEQFDFDYIGADALERVLRVEDGLIHSLGARYRVLFLGGSSRRMSLRTLMHLERLVDAGATIIGDRPESSPSLADEDDAFDAACDRLWEAGRIRTGDVRTALSDLGIAPRLLVEGAAVRRISRMIGGHHVTFLANPSGEEVHVRLTPDDTRGLCAWDPVEVRAYPLRSGAADIAGRGTWSLTLPPFGSLFILPAHTHEPEPFDVPSAPGYESTPPPVAIDLAGDWTRTIAQRPAVTTRPHPQFWTEGDGAARGFSGVADYRHTFTWDHTAPRSALLHVEALGAIARVEMNGMDCGIIWTAPFRIDVSAALRSGENLLRIHVATPWRNRLIHEASQPTGEVFEPMTTVFEPDAAPLPAGLSGRVWLTARM